MKPGKVSETVLKRSILKEIKYKRPEIIHGASLSHDCPGIKAGEGEDLLFCVYPNLHGNQEKEILGINTVINGLAASGAEPLGVLLTMILPETFQESDLKQMMRNFNTECEKYKIQIMGGHTEFTNAVNRPVITLTGVGRAREESLLSLTNCRPGQDIVMSKYIAIEGTYLSALEHMEEIEERFNKSYIRKFLDFKNDLSIVNEAAVAIKHGVTAMHDVKEGGIFSALWELGAAAKTGLSVDLKSISVKQETIEICELLGVNPYQLLSGGALLMVSEDGTGLVKELNEQGIPASLIGKLTRGNEKVIMNEEEKRFLEPPGKDEIIKII